MIIHGSITGIAGNPLEINGPVNAPTLVAGIKADVDALDARVRALESADTTAP